MAHPDCTAFCERNCQYVNEHHPLLLALIQSSTKLGYMRFKEEVKRLELTTTWQKNDPIPDACPDYRYPIIHWAAVLGKTRVIQWCIDEKVDLFQTCGNRGETALHRLVICGYEPLEETSENFFQLFEDVVDLLEILLDQRDDNQDLPLHVGAKVVVEQYGKVSQTNFNNYVKMVEILAQKTSQMHMDLLDSWNTEGNTVLHILAVNDKHFKLVKTLVDYGADIDIKNEEGQTPLDVAKGNGARGIFKLLIRTAKKNRSLLDSSFFEDGYASDESSIEYHPRGRIAGKVYTSDCDSDINHHESDNYDQEETPSEPGTERTDWPSMGKSPSFMQSYQLGNMHLKRKSPDFEVETPLKKLKEKLVVPHFSKQLSPNVVIAPLQMSFDIKGRASPFNVESNSVQLGDINNDSEHVYVTAEDKRACSKSIEEDQKQSSKVFKITGESSQWAITGQKWPVEQLNNELNVNHNVSNESCTATKSRKRIEDIVQNIKERQEFEGRRNLILDHTVPLNCVSGGLNSEQTENSSVSKVTFVAATPHVAAREELHNDGEITEKFPANQGPIPVAQADKTGRKTTETVTVTSEDGNYVLPEATVAEYQNSAAEVPQQQHHADRASVHNTPFAETAEKVNHDNQSKTGNPLTSVTVKVEKEDNTSTRPSSNMMLDNLQTLLTVLSKKDLEELVQKTMKQAHETIGRLHNEVGDASHNEREQHQKYMLVQERIKTHEEQVKQLQREITQCRKEAEGYQKGRELARKKKVTCQEQIVLEEEKIPTIKALLDTLE